jgi:hypothetical protein
MTAEDFIKKHKEVLFYALESAAGWEEVDSQTYNDIGSAWDDLKNVE